MDQGWKHWKGGEEMRRKWMGLATAIVVAAVTQLVGVVIAVEGQRHRAAAAVRPGRGLQRTTGADLRDPSAPLVFRPFPRLHRDLLQRGK